MLYEKLPRGRQGADEGLGTGLAKRFCNKDVVIGYKYSNRAERGHTYLPLWASSWMHWLAFELPSRRRRCHASPSCEFGAPMCASPLGENSQNERECRKVALVAKKHKEN